MNRIKERKVGDIEIYVNSSYELYVEDRRSGKTWDITGDYVNRKADKQLLDEVERRVRSGDLLMADGRGRGTLLGFLRS